MFKMYPSKRKLANERTNVKISPETQVLAHWKVIFSYVRSFVEAKAFLITLRCKWETKEQKHSQSFTKLAVPKRWSLNSLIRLFATIRILILDLTIINRKIQRYLSQETLFGFKYKILKYALLFEA